MNRICTILRFWIINVKQTPCCHYQAVLSEWEQSETYKAQLFLNTTAVTWNRKDNDLNMTLPTRLQSAGFLYQRSPFFAAESPELCSIKCLLPDCPCQPEGQERDILHSSTICLCIPCTFTSSDLNCIITQGKGLWTWRSTMNGKKKKRSFALKVSTFSMYFSLCRCKITLQH